MIAASKSAAATAPKGNPIMKEYPDLLGRFRVDGKVALVTGGTRGIGLAITNALAQAGARVFIGGRKLGEKAERMLRTSGHDASFLACDLTEPAAPARLIDAVIAGAGRLDILVNNAGIAIHGDTAEFSDEDLDRLMSLNFDAVFRWYRATIPALRAAGGSAVVNVRSMSGIA